MKKILVVEDVEFNRDLLVQLLEDEYEVLTAVDGAEGIERAEREHPDLILMDLSLPVIDGWEAARRIKADPGLKHIPIIALSAHAMTGDEAKARESGCDDYISKPLNEDLLFEKLTKLLGGSEHWTAGAGSPERAESHGLWARCWSVLDAGIVPARGAFAEQGRTRWTDHVPGGRARGARRLDHRLRRQPSQHLG